MSVKADAPGTLRVMECNQSVIDGKLSVIVPAYNEAAHLSANLDETITVLAAMGVDARIIVVDDGSRDRTCEVANLAAQRHPHISVVSNPSRQGKGSALARGAMHAQGDYVAFLDADLELHPSQLQAFFDVLHAENADAVIGCKLHPMSRVAFPPLRRLMSVSYYAVVRALFDLPVRDTQTGLKLFKTAVLRDVVPKLRVKGFAFDLELLVLAHDMGYKISEAPVEMDFRRIAGRIGIADILHVLKDTLVTYARYRLRRRPASRPLPDEVPAVPSGRTTALSGR